MSWPSQCLLAAGALTLGRALQISNGYMDPAGLRWLLVAAACTILAVVFARSPAVSGQKPGGLAAILFVGVLLQLLQLVTTSPLRYATFRQGDPLPAGLISGVLLGSLATVIAFGRPRARAAAFAAFIAWIGVLGLWSLRLAPNPEIDVFTVQRHAIARLGALETPYTMSFPNIYGDDRYYGEGVTAGDRVLFGLPYPPLTLAFTAPAEWVFGDFRIGHGIALLAAAVLIASLGWTARSMLAAALLLTTPRVLYVLEQGWTEPSAVMLMALTSAAAWRHSSHAWMALGLTVAVKQYLVVLAPLAVLLRRPGEVTWRRALLVALATGAVVTVPFFLWDPGGFTHSVLLLQFREPFRMDSLSLLAWAKGQGLPAPAMAMTLLAAAAAVTLALWRLPRSTSGFASGVALVTFLLFLFGKKAFCNYYFFVLGAMVIALAAAGEEGRGEKTIWTSDLPAPGAAVD